MTDHQFTYPRVLPGVLAEKAAGRPDPNARAARFPRTQRELVAASLVRCPPRDRGASGKGRRSERA